MIWLVLWQRRRFLVNCSLNILFTKSFCGYERLGMNCKINQMDYVYGVFMLFSLNWSFCFNAKFEGMKSMCSCKKTSIHKHPLSSSFLQLSPMNRDTVKLQDSRIWKYKCRRYRFFCHVYKANTVVLKCFSGGRSLSPLKQKFTRQP